jgi:hypothetical protein
MKGYPKSRFDIVNQTQIQSIETSTVDTPTALYMQMYTSNKGTEDWELLYGFDNFTTIKGGISFNKHGQALLTVAEALRSGAYVLGKRMVSEDATLANVTIMARVIKVDNVSYLYIYTKSGINCTTFDDACEAGYGTFDPENEVTDATEIPLFTVAPMGRGESTLFFGISPEYASSRNKSSSDYIKYSFEVIEDNETLESIIVTMNPEIIVDGVAQAINPKIKANSNQVRVKLYEDGVYSLVTALAKTAVNGNKEAIAPADLINLDFINGYNRKGTEAIGGIVTIQQSTKEADDLWTKNKPSDITTPYDLSSSVGVPLVNGSYGTMGTSPMSNAAEYKKMLLASLGKDTDSILYDSVIYDLDAYKVDAMFDCNYPMEVKNAIVDLVDFRGDMVFIADLGTTANTLSLIKEQANNIHFSNYTAIYHNYFKIIDPYTRKEITVTMPYLLVPKMVEHISKGVGRPFAGISNDITFPDIIDGSINFLPVEIPGIDQKQELVDNNINYISMYDGTPVMETMYVNAEDYTQLSFLHNIMGVQEVIKAIRTRCPRIRYTFLDGSDLETYIEDVQQIITQYSTNFKSITCEYMADEKYEQNNIFYAVLKVQFKNFDQEEYFKIIAIS